MWFLCILPNPGRSRTRTPSRSGWAFFLLLQLEGGFVGDDLFILTELTPGAIFQVDCVELFLASLVKNFRNFNAVVRLATFLILPLEYCASSQVAERLFNSRQINNNYFYTLTLFCIFAYCAFLRTKANTQLGVLPS